MVKVREQLCELRRTLHRSGRRQPSSLCVNEFPSQIIADETGAFTSKGDVLDRVEPGMIERSTHLVQAFHIQKAGRGRDLSRQQTQDFVSGGVPFVNGQVDSQVRPGFQGAKNSVA